MIGGIQALGHARTRSRSTSKACIPYAAAKFPGFSRPLTTPNAPFVFLTGSVHATARNNAFTLVEWTDPVRKTKGAFGVVRGREKVQKGAKKNALRSISPQGVSLTSPSHPRHPQKIRVIRVSYIVLADLKIRFQRIPSRKFPFLVENQINSGLPTIWSSGT